MPMHDWFNRYPKTQRLKFVRAYADMKSGGLTMKECCKNDVMVKIEATQKVKPRIVVVCKDKMKVALGPWQKSFAYTLANQWHYQHYIYCAVGDTQKHIAQWVEEGNRQFGSSNAIKDDFTDFDNTHSLQSLRFYVETCEACGASGFAQIALRSQLRRQIYKTRDGTVVDLAPKLGSGKPNTTDTNNFINAASHYWAYTTMGFQPGRDFRIMVTGDDNVTYACEELCKRAAEISPLLKSLGFISKAERTNKFGLRFCSKAFFPIDDCGHVMPGPLPGKCMLKIGFTTATLPKRPTARMAHRRGVALGLIEQARHVPLLGSYLEKELDMTQGTYSQADHTIQNAAAKSKQLYHFTGANQKLHDTAFAFHDTMIGAPIGATRAWHNWYADCGGLVGYYGTKQLLAGFTVAQFVSLMRATI